jgi:hypothetical protein
MDNKRTVTILWAICAKNPSRVTRAEKRPFSLARQFGQMMRRVVNLACSCFGEARFHRIDLIREGASDLLEARSRDDDSHDSTAYLSTHRRACPESFGRNS